MGFSQIVPTSDEHLNDPERGKSAYPTCTGISPCESHGYFSEFWIQNVVALSGTVHHAAMGLRYVLLHRWSDVVAFLGMRAWDFPHCARPLMIEGPHPTFYLEVGSFYM